MTMGRDTEDRFALRDAPPIELDRAGFSHPDGPRAKRSGFSRYVDITHVALSPRGVWIATEDDLIIVPQDRLESSAEARRLRDALIARVAALPDGDVALARMAELDAIDSHEGTPYAVNLLSLVCLAMFALELAFHPEIFFVGQFSPRLVMAGDVWRLVTANLLHGGWIHLAMNLFGLFVLGRLVERDIGTTRTVCVMGISAVSAMALSGVFADEEVVGVSGVVLGMGGALVAIEMLRRHQQPAWFRVPRGLRQLLIVALVADILIGWSVPFIAGAAHFGGLLGGFLSTAIFTASGLYHRGVVATRGLAVVVVAISVGSVVWAGAELAEGQYVARHIARLTELPGVSLNEINNVAWRTAIDDDATRVELLAALHLAKLAVEETGEEKATVLDTLAEVQFALQRPQDAIETIDRAIALEPEVSYFREQRRRYTGERAAHDRPPDPQLPPPQRRVPTLSLDEVPGGPAPR